MSEITTAQVWSASKSRRGSRLVMLAIAREADDHGKAIMTLDEISRLTGLTVRGISKCLGELASLGELSRQRGGGNSNPNSYSILLLDQSCQIPTPTGAEVPDSMDGAEEEGTEFPEVSSDKRTPATPSGKFRQEESEVHSSRARGGSTPVGSTTTTQKQASLPDPSRKNHRSSQGSVTVPDDAKELVAAMTSSGMLVGWRLTKSEWGQVAALVNRWGHEHLVEMVSRRWNSDRPPQSARYLLRIWADLPAEAPVAASLGNVVPLRRQPGGWVPFQNTANASAYQNGF